MDHPGVVTMVSRFIRPIFSWSQDAFRVAPLALAASARGSLMAALGGAFQRQHPQQQHSLQSAHMHQQQRHRWAGTAEFNGSEQAAMEFLNDGAQFEGLAKRWSARKYYIKPFVQRKQRYNRWVRRRSLEKINHILNKVRYEKGIAKSANPQLAAIFSGKAAAQAAVAAEVEASMIRK